MSFDQVTSDMEDTPEIETNSNQFVTFSVEGEIFAAPMAPVQEIIRVPNLAQVPLAPPSLLGLANLRGRILPIVNLRRIFGLADIEDTDATRALVINLGTPLGFVVDRVASVIAVDEADIEPATAIGASVDARLLTGVVKLPNGEMIMILDFAQLIAREFVGTPMDGRISDVAIAGDISSAAGDDEEEIDADEIQLVSFTVEGQEYAADIAAVQEIVQMPERVVAIPNAPLHVLGLMTLRERLLPLVSLRVLLGLPEKQENEDQRIIVLGLGEGQAVGVVADSVDEVLRVPRGQVETLPAILASRGGLEEISAVCRLDGGKRLVSILDTDRMFANAAMKTALAKASAMETDMIDADSEMDEHDIAEDEEQVVVFRLGSEEFGVPIAAVHEIVRIPESLTRVPTAPSFVEGVINLRGAVLPVIDQRRRLNLEDIERNDRQRIMVYALNGRRTGFIVDSVTEVLKIPRNAIERSPRLSSDQHRILGRVANLEKQKRMIMLMDPDALLSETELADLEA
ncbi:chemotaxis protein CheW [Rhizobium sp. NFR03]|uniref:chemotaxis protein CheW n=1 Tax=Rhizobium sp. NFR03 TaxID=1566263 RepID=UPI0008ABE15D|nr:chemotaxis protein CheW [Rhizobium sp. NFR03]SES23296.1 purine-binding chemotaxis protein CheW [Rhizobium sp. NFR03]